MAKRLMIAFITVLALGVQWVSPPPAGALGPPTAHLAVIVMENKEYTTIVGNTTAAPYINNTLIPGARLFTQYYAVTHPSLPNYLVLTSGSTAGCVSDTCAPGFDADENLLHQMNTAPEPITWKVYAESMPSNCAPANSWKYLVRHNPAPYYSDLGSSGDGTCATNDVPYSQLATDIQGNTLPQFLWVTPNGFNDMHSNQNSAGCLLDSAVQNEVCQGDRWLAANLPPLLSDNGLNDVTVVIVFDEGSSKQLGGGHVAVIEEGPSIGGGTLGTQMTHYLLLNAIEDWFELPRLPSVPAL